MKLLLDTCVNRRAREPLSEAGHEVDAVAEWSSDPGGEEILRRANGSGQVLITLDKDFGKLTVVGGMPHKGIIRLVDVRGREQGVLARKILRLHASDLSASAIITADASRIRVRKPRS